MDLIDANLSNVKKVDKPWGYEIWMANNESNDYCGYCGKILFIKKGFESSLHFHYEKTETLYVQSGLLKVKLIDTQKGEEHEGVIKEGQSLEVNPPLPHKLIALEDTIIIESSTFHKDSDSYRISR